jgi:hypothetical protein
MWPADARAIFADRKQNALGTRLYTAPTLEVKFLVSVVFLGVFIFYPSIFNVQTVLRIKSSGSRVGKEVSNKAVFNKAVFNKLLWSMTELYYLKRESPV